MYYSCFEVVACARIAGRLGCVLDAKCSTGYWVEFGSACSGLPDAP